MSVVISDNSYGSPAEQSQRGPRTRHGVKGSPRGYRAPGVGRRKVGKRK